MPRFRLDGEGDDSGSDGSTTSFTSESSSGLSRARDKARHRLTRDESVSSTTVTQTQSLHFHELSQRGRSAGATTVTETPSLVFQSAAREDGENSPSLIDPRSAARSTGASLHRRHGAPSRSPEAAPAVRREVRQSLSFDGGEPAPLAKTQPQMRDAAAAALPDVQDLLAQASPGDGALFPAETHVNSMAGHSGGVQHDAWLSGAADTGWEDGQQAQLEDVEDELRKMGADVLGRIAASSASSPPDPDPKSPDMPADAGQPAAPLVLSPISAAPEDSRQTFAIDSSDSESDERGEASPMPLYAPVDDEPPTQVPRNASTHSAPSGSQQPREHSAAAEVVTCQSVSPSPRREESARRPSVARSSKSPSIRPSQPRGASRPAAEGAAQVLDALRARSASVSQPQASVARAPSASDRAASERSDGKAGGQTRRAVYFIPSLDSELAPHGTPLASQTDAADGEGEEATPDMDIAAGVALDVPGEYRDLSRQGLTGVYLTTPGMLSNITVLNVAQNNIAELPALPATLVSLDASQNALTAVTGLGLCRHLEVANLRRNKLASVDGLAPCLRLRYLFLGRNCLRRIEGLEHLINLETLDVGHNQLATAASVRALSLHPRLTALTVAGNPLADAAGRRKLCFAQLPPWLPVEGLVGLCGPYGVVEHAELNGRSGGSATFLTAEGVVRRVQALLHGLRLPAQEDPPAQPTGRRSTGKRCDSPMTAARKQGKIPDGADGFTVRVEVRADVKGKRRVALVSGLPRQRPVAVMDTLLKALRVSGSVASIEELAPRGWEWRDKPVPGRPAAGAAASKWTPYDGTQSALLLKVWAHAKPGAKELIDLGGVVWDVDFGAMTKRHAVSGKVRELRPPAFTASVRVSILPAEKSAELARRHLHDALLVGGIQEAMKAQFPILLTVEGEREAERNATIDESPVAAALDLALSVCDTETHMSVRQVTDYVPAVLNLSPHLLCLDGKFISKRGHGHDRPAGPHIAPDPRRTAGLISANVTSVSAAGHHDAASVEMSALAADVSRHHVHGESLHAHSSTTLQHSAVGMEVDGGRGAGRRSIGYSVPGRASLAAQRMASHKQSEEQRRRKERGRGLQPSQQAQRNLSASRTRSPSLRSAYGSMLNATTASTASSAASPGPRGQPRRPPSVGREDAKPGVVTAKAVHQGALSPRTPMATRPASPSQRRSVVVPSFPTDDARVCEGGEGPSSLGAVDVSGASGAGAEGATQLQRMSTSKSFGSSGWRTFHRDPARGGQAAAAHPKSATPRAKAPPVQAGVPSQGQPQQMSPRTASALPAVGEPPAGPAGGTGDPLAAGYLESVMGKALKVRSPRIATAAAPRGGAQRPPVQLYVRGAGEAPPPSTPPAPRAAKGLPAAPRDKGAKVGVTFAKGSTPPAQQQQGASPVSSTYERVRERIAAAAPSPRVPPPAQSESDGAMTGVMGELLARAQGHHVPHTFADRLAVAQQGAGAPEKTSVAAWLHDFGNAFVMLHLALKTLLVLVEEGSSREIVRYKSIVASCGLLDEVVIPSEVSVGYGLTAHSEGVAPSEPVTERDKIVAMVQQTRQTKACLVYIFKLMDKKDYPELADYLLRVKESLLMSDAKP